MGENNLSQGGLKKKEKRTKDYVFSCFGTAAKSLACKVSPSDVWKHSLSDARRRLPLGRRVSPGAELAGGSASRRACDAAVRSGLWGGAAGSRF